MPSLHNLPTELLTEIVKYYPVLLSNIDAYVRGVPGDQFDGDDTLRALSQTCRALRDVFLPVLWERIHATFSARTRPKRRIRTRAKMLERRMRGIQKTPHVVPYIRHLAITLEECNMSNWQPMAHFIQVLDLLPALRSLTIYRITTEMIKVLRTSCQGKLYSAIVTLAVPDELAPILHCFPNIETLTACNRGSWYPYSFPLIPGKLFSAAKDHCKHIRTVNNLPLWVEAINSFREGIPNVQHLSIWQNHHPDKLRLLEGMDNLSELVVRHGSRDYNNIRLPLEELIAAAERILRSSKAPRHKVLRVQHLVEGQSDDIVREETLIVVGGRASYPS
ncbi:hypothetical protein B0H14DRAFT_2787877 [Mycena olivaceomarginata]|nr:hypothetical protein B0H14DRAFT_2787877 [Mycena olivaceomarginata]